MRSPLYFLKNPREILLRGMMKCNRLFSDKCYIRTYYRIALGKRLNLKDPETFNEKLQWLKLNDHNPDYPVLVDKVSAKQEVAKRIDSQHIIPTYAVYDSAEEIDFDALPSRFVIKCSHSGGNNAVFVVPDKDKADLVHIRSSLARQMKDSLYPRTREWPYKSVKPRILVEQLLGDGHIEDFKFNCYNGFAESVMLCTGRETGETKFYFFDRDWNLKRYNKRGKEAPTDFTLPKPKNLDRMFEIASALSEGYPFVRVDLYNVDGHIYFGEMTFYPASGFDANLLPETDHLFGSMIKLK